MSHLLLLHRGESDDHADPRRYGVADYRRQAHCYAAQLFRRPRPGSGGAICFSFLI
jgi:hypothetical protein